MRVPVNLGAVWPWESEFWECLNPWEECFWRGRQLEVPVAPPAPPAPQTTPKMTTWVPEDIWEAIAQQRQALERAGQPVQATAPPPVRCAWYQNAQEGVCRFGGLNAWAAVAALGVAGVLIVVQRRRR